MRKKSKHTTKEKNQTTKQESKRKEKENRTTKVRKQLMKWHLLCNYE